MHFQQTLAGAIRCHGHSLHLGAPIEMSMLPGPIDGGLIFRRADLPGRPAVKASTSAVVETKRCVSIGRDGWRISTIEHLMAAAHGLGLDNAVIEVDGAELPIGDGSALFFTDLIARAGLTAQSAPRRTRRIDEPIWVAENGGYLIALPPTEESLTVSYTFSADDRPIPAQYRRFILGADDFLAEIAPARTVAFIEEIEALRGQGLAQSTEIDVVVAVGAEGYLNQLRLPDEIVRHKILDLLGDLYLLGPLSGQIIGVRSGHRLNHLLAGEIMRRIPEPVAGA